MKTSIAVLTILLAGQAAAQNAERGGPSAGAEQPEKPSKAKQPLPGTASEAAPSGSMPTEVIIKGDDQGSKLGAQKPPLNIDVDPFESIRPSLAPDQALLLAVSPLTVSWRRTHPEFLSEPRVIQPWRTTFSQRPGIAFRVRDQLQDVLGRRMEAKETKNYAWSLTLADEEGRVFHHYEGSDDPPEELLWAGQNEQGEWIRAGRSYSAVYTFTDPGGSPRTAVGKPILFRGIVHQEDTGMHVSLDSSALFGTNKSNTELAAPTGVDVLRAAADLIKRRFTGIPISVRVFAATKELGDAQGASIYSTLLKELMLTAKNVTVDSARASFSDQRVEIVLLNR